MLLQWLSFFVVPLHIICFYILFFTQNWTYVKKLHLKKIFKLLTAVIGLIIVQFFIEMWAPFQWMLIFCSNLVTIIFLVLITYLCLKQHNHFNISLRINILLSVSIFIAVQIFCALLDKYLVMVNHTDIGHPTPTIIILHNLIEAILAFVVGWISRKMHDIYHLNDKHVDKQLYRIAIIIFIIVYTLTLFYTLMEKLYSYVDNLAVFFAILIIIFGIFYFLINRREKRRLRDKMVEERLSNLKKYTDHLEQEQRKLRKFKHDYQNMLLSLEGNLRLSNSQDAKDCIQSFKKYSDNYINKSDLWIFNDFDKVKAPYLKSIFINKTSQATEQGIDVHFECKYDVNEIPMEPYDLVRIIGIEYDNAIEAVHDFDENHKKINIMVYRTEGQTEITIANPVLKSKNLAQIKKEGITTKKGHSGFGLANIDEISNNYSNLLVNYQEVKGWFTVQFVIMDKQDRKKKKRKNK